MLDLHVDALERYLEAYPELKDCVRVGPLRVKRDGRWRSVKEVRAKSVGFELKCVDNSRVLILPQTSRVAQRNTQLPETSRLIKGFYSRFQVLKMLCHTDRKDSQTGAFSRMIIRSRGQTFPLMLVYEGEAPELESRLLSALVLWWDSLLEKKYERIDVWIPNEWGHRVVTPLVQLRIPVNCFSYSLADRNVLQIFPVTSGFSKLRSPFVMFPMVPQTPVVISTILKDYSDLDLIYRKNRWELSYKGLPVVWQEGVGCSFDYFCPKPAYTRNIGSIEQHIRHVIRFRSFPPLQPSSPYYRFGQERWLESLVLRSMAKIDSEFLETVYCQVPTCVGSDRKVLDLLTLTKQGRLAVIELKLEKDLSLIFQGLDYWNRVNLHLNRRDFQRSGYFPEDKLSNESPLLYLICPLFEFHRTLPILRRFIESSIQFCCIGINQDWRRGLKILRRFDF